MARTHTELLEHLDAKQSQYPDEYYLTEILRDMECEKDRIEMIMGNDSPYLASYALKMRLVSSQPLFDEIVQLTNPSLHKLSCVACAISKTPINHNPCLRSCLSPELTT